MIAGKRLQAESFQHNLQNNPVGRVETFFQTSVIIKDEKVCWKCFVAVSGSLWKKVPVLDDVLSFHEKEIYPTNSLDENCIELEFQTDRNYYFDLRQTYLVFKLNFVEDRCYESHNIKEVKKESKEETMAVLKLPEDKQEAPLFSLLI